jgi:hypothetical protein
MSRVGGLVIRRGFEQELAYYTWVPDWFRLIMHDDVDTLRHIEFDPNAIPRTGHSLPLEYAIRSRVTHVVRVLLELGASITHPLFDNETALSLAQKCCAHPMSGQLGIGCCCVLKVIQHAHDLPPRLCATSWSFAQMSGVWRDLIQPVVEERMSKEEF